MVANCVSDSSRSRRSCLSLSPNAAMPPTLRAALLLPQLSSVLGQRCATDNALCLVRNGDLMKHTQEGSAPRGGVALDPRGQRMKLYVDTSNKQVTVSKAPEEKTDQNNRQRTDRVTGALMWATQVFVLDEDGGQGLS